MNKFAIFSWKIKKRINELFWKCNEKRSSLKQVGFDGYGRELLMVIANRNQCGGKGDQTGRLLPLVIDINSSL